MKPRLRPPGSPTPRSLRALASSSLLLLSLLSSVVNNDNNTSLGAPAPWSPGVFAETSMIISSIAIYC